MEDESITPNDGIVLVTCAYDIIRPLFGRQPKLQRLAECNALTEVLLQNQVADVKMYKTLACNVEYVQYSNSVEFL